MNITITNWLHIALYEAIGDPPIGNIVTQISLSGNYKTIVQNQEIIFLHESCELMGNENWKFEFELNGPVEHFGRLMLFDSESYSLISKKIKENENWVIDDYIEVRTEEINNCIIFTILCLMSQFVHQPTLIFIWIVNQLFIRL